jgi:hypothetical protein
MFLLSACGGGGGGGSTDTPFDPGAGSNQLPTGPEELVLPNAESFSPMFEGADGADLPVINWVYQVNGGLPIEVVTQEGVFALTFADRMVVSFDPGGGIKMTNLPFAFTGTLHGQPGTVTGMGSAGILEMADRAGGCPVFLERTAMLSMADEAETFSFDAKSELRYGKPLQWLPDCTDLQTRVGVGGDELIEASPSLLSGSTTCSMNGLPARLEEFDGICDSADEWTVSGIQDELVVAGRVFHDVVEVELLTTVPDLGQPALPGQEVVRTVRMWFAKSVGLIRAEGAFLLWGQSVDVDLVDILR